jgi:hypothetical protein
MMLPIFKYFYNQQTLSMNFLARFDYGFSQDGINENLEEAMAFELFEYNRKNSRGPSQPHPQVSVTEFGSVRFNAAAVSKYKLIVNSFVQILIDQDRSLIGFKFSNVCPNSQTRKLGKTFSISIKSVFDYCQYSLSTTKWFELFEED